MDYANLDLPTLPTPMHHSTRLPFRPFPLFAPPHLQTIIAARLHFGGPPPSVQRTLTLADGDKLALMVSTPNEWPPDGPTVVLLHGLCGCSRSSYMIRMTRKLFRRGIRVVRMNHRGCGEGAGQARHPYHSGRSEDVLAVLDDLRSEWPHSPTTVVGFSLSGNIVLKLAGEFAGAPPPTLAGVIAVAPPADLAACSKRLLLRSNRMYDRYFVRLLVRSVIAHADLNRDNPPPEFPKDLTLRGFDELYTAPRSGFRDATDYYSQCSAIRGLEKISVPTKILFADDDPLIDPNCLNSRGLPRHVEVYRTRRGGHLGYLGIPGLAGGYRWLDATLLAWICGAPSRDPLPTS